MLKSLSEILASVVTQWPKWNHEATSQLLLEIYETLRRFTRNFLDTNGSNSSLRPTVLIRSVFDQLVEEKRMDPEDQPFFYIIASRMMRHIMLDYWLLKKLYRHGREDKKALAETEDVPKGRNIDFLTLEKALNLLEEIDSSYLQIFELRFYGGFSVTETAEILNLPVEKVERNWKATKVWIFRQLQVG